MQNQALHIDRKGRGGLIAFSPLGVSSDCFNARFINHSDLANIAFVDDYTEIALREVKPEEEILENYLFSYDNSDFFFQELVNPDPLFYFNTILQKDRTYAKRQNLS